MRSPAILSRCLDNCLWWRFFTALGTVYRYCKTFHLFCVDHASLSVLAVVYEASILLTNDEACKLSPEELLIVRLVFNSILLRVALYHVRFCLYFACIMRTMHSMVSISFQCNLTVHLAVLPYVLV